MKREPQAKDFHPSSFIHQYMKYMEGLETSYVYDFWCACWLVSMACGRDVVVARPRIPIYMNMYLCLVADSAVTRKSTSVVHATQLAKRTDYGKPRYEWIESRMSVARLETRMSDLSDRENKAWAAISVSEMVNFFGKARSTGIVGLLTDLYDCPTSRIGGGTNASPSDTHLKNVFISLLTASTPTWLMQEITPSIIEGGFTSRCIFVWSEEPKTSISWPHDMEVERYNALITSLYEIRSRILTLGSIGINDKAKKRFDSWYRSRHIYRDSFRASFGGREDSHVLRLAAILCISDGTYQIQLQHIEAAIKYVIQVRDKAVGLFEGIGSRTATVIAIDRIRDALIGSGREVVTGTDLARKTQAFISGEKRQAILDIMHEMSLLQVFTIPAKKQGGRPLTVYRGTKHLTRKGAVDEIITQLP
jgi:hypothetical protein